MSSDFILFYFFTEAHILADSTAWLEIIITKTRFGMEEELGM